MTFRRRRLPASTVKALERELANFSTDLAEKTRWLVLNKIDLLDEEALAAARDDIVRKLDWDGPVFEVSAATGEGTEQLAQAVMQALETAAELEEAEA